MVLHYSDLPRGMPDTHASQDKAPRALWVDAAQLEASLNWVYEPGRIFLGKSNDQPIGTKDNRHLLTIAGSRSGKGTSCIVPNLLTYTGSVLVIDPKGENATLSAERRGNGKEVPDGGLGQDVYVLDPFEVADVDDAYRASFNPLDGLNSRSDDFIDECDAIADALVVEEKAGENSHFYDSARLVLRGYIAWVVAHADVKDKSLNEVKRLMFLPRHFGERAKNETVNKDVNDPKLTFNQLSALMMWDGKFAHGIPNEAASMLTSMGEREFGSVMSTIRNQIGFISSPPVSRMLAGEERKPNITNWKQGMQTVYLCLPAGRLHRHSRFFRLFINRLMNAIEADPSEPDIPALMILDEMHVLGHMKSLETAAGLIAGFGVRIWSFFQDLSQLRQIYGDRWETFLGNAAIFQTFGLNDLGSLKYVSERLGQSAMFKSSSSEQSLQQSASGFSGQSHSIEGTPLLMPDEVAAFFSRQSENQLIIYPGTSGIFLKRVPYYDPFFDGVRVDK
ncbi:type IV secretory system conjugative DNA transfer family protein [Roseobacter sp.]|uniref:type IV secretory system conjugative DNA transfer family protein n=1 Tax=Roseobacter sp. TaxID=1907202 RepID=UPI002966FEC1|nr:type IV secretory system conjugative DNA transfer family protein [Roseobacter sp.]MDW3181644.1 type IV secretory system conjugative DNA transfer family protein [Roseobacter sp.]